MPEPEDAGDSDVAVLESTLRWLAILSILSTIYIGTSAWLAESQGVWRIAALSGLVALSASIAARFVASHMVWAISAVTGVTASSAVIAAALAPPLAPAASFGGLALLAFAVVVPSRETRRVVQWAGSLTALAGVGLLLVPVGDPLPALIWLPPTLAVMMIVLLASNGSRKVMERRLERLAEARVTVATHDARASASEDALRERAGFHASLQHELRAPLQSMLYAVSSFRERHPADADELESSALHLASLLDDLMDVASIDAGHWRMRDETFEASTALMEAIDIVSGLAASTKTRIDVTMAGLAPAYRGDPRRLRQVVINLVGNAARHAPDGMVQVALLGTYDGLQLRVDDDGPGFEAPELLRAFEQGHRPGKRGLGLHVVASIADALGGRVEMSRSDLGGARVDVTWPAKPCASVPVAPTRLDGMQVLICDDDPLMSMLARDVLVDAGAECTITERVQDAIQALRELPDLVLMDMHLPDGRGDAILGPAQASRTKVIFLTGGVEADVANSLMANGASAVLEKPCTPEDLVAAAGAARTTIA